MDLVNFFFGNLLHLRNFFNLQPKWHLWCGCYIMGQVCHNLCQMSHLIFVTSDGPVMVMLNPYMCDERVTFVSHPWHNQKLETCKSWSTTQSDNQYNIVESRGYMVWTTLQKVFLFFSNFSIRKAWYVKFPCQIKDLGVIWKNWFNHHISAQLFLATYQLKIILKLVTEPNFLISFI